MRDDFDKKIKDALARRVGFRCSNPKCRRLTVGPQTNGSKAVNIGVAAHITAASSGGPRYVSNLSSEQRKGINNGVWLCQTCSKLIDSDVQKYTIEVLLAWKSQAEALALSELEEKVPPRATSGTDPLDIFNTLLEHPNNWIKVQGDQYIRHRYKPEFIIKANESVRDDYSEPWTERFPDKQAWSFDVEYRHGSTLLKISRFIVADGGRYNIPLPKLRNLNPDADGWEHIEFSIDVKSLEWKTAMLFDQYCSLWSVLPQVGISLIR